MRTIGFRAIPDEPLRAVVVGAGEMGKVWLRTVDSSPDVTLAGVVDLDVARAESVVAEMPTAVPCGGTVREVASEGNANVVINVTVPDAHLAVTLDSLEAGLPVLGEKPLASTVSDALVLAAASELSGELFMVSQSRRYNSQLPPYKQEIQALGGAGILTTVFYRAPRFGGYRDAMAHPLLLDFAIHPFDTARWLMDADPVSVLCDESNPSWSWYDGAAAATATFDMGAERRYVFTGSWCSPAAETSWNGAWRASTIHGTASWDGDNPCQVDGPDGRVTGEAPHEHGESTAGALAEFVTALRTSRPPMGQVHDNVMSLAMVVAAIEAADSGRRVLIDDVLQSALDVARKAASPAIKDVLADWHSVREALAVTVAPRLAAAPATTANS